MFINAYQGDEIFQKKLEKLEIPMSVWELRMYILGFLLSPENIQISQVLEEILLTDTPDEVVFDDERDYEEFLQLFAGLWNQLTSYDGSTSRVPRLSPKKNEFKDDEDKAEYIAAKGEELGSFFAGLSESGASEYIDQCYDLLMSQIGLSMISDLLIDFSIEFVVENKYAVDDLDELLGVVDDFHENWNVTYPKMNKLFMAIRRGEIALDSEEEMERKLSAALEEE